MAPPWLDLRLSHRQPRYLKVLEWIATKEARTLLLELATGAPDARLTDRFQITISVGW